MDLSRIRKGVNNPRLAWVTFWRSVNALYHTRLNSRPYNPDGIDIFAEDWDNLIILDACRVDTLRKVGIEGEITTKQTRGSATHEFLEANFADRQLHNVVYISANAWYPRLKDRIHSEVHRFINLQRSEYQDEYFGIEPPDVIADEAIKAAAEYPNKRLLIHFIQPHYPFIGPIGRENIPPKTQMTEAIFDADCGEATIRKAYRENLELVIPEVERLIENLKGKTVVTADHGELLGERSFPVPYKEFGHPTGTYVSELVNVPWVERDSEERRDIRSEPPVTDTTKISRNEVDERLKNLGYKT